jgi:hypothetical protein
MKSVIYFIPVIITQVSLLDSNNDRDEINDRFHTQVSLLDSNNDRDEINDRFHAQVSLLEKSVIYFIPVIITI